jgi:hypothetical protein
MLNPLNSNLTLKLFFFSYVLTVVATDGGSPTPLVGEAQLKIRVLDENDQVPTFPTSKWIFPLSEGTKIGSAVHRFQAVDRDLGHNGRVKYFLGGGDHRNLVNFINLQYC